MSETKKMTKQEILEIFKGEYKSVRRKYERKVEKYATEMMRIMNTSSVGTATRCIRLR